MYDVSWSVAAGFVLGLMFYGGLWWTVRHATDFRSPASTMLGLALLRLSATLAGFHWVASGEWSQMLLCLLGFLLARLAVTWATRLPSTAILSSPSTPTSSRHAP